MPRRPLRLKILLALLALGVPAVLTPPALYWIGLGLAPELPEPPPETTPLPPNVEAALWTRFGGEGPPSVEPTTTGRFLRFEWCMAWTHFRNGDLDSCYSRELDLMLAGAVSAQHLGLRGGDPEGGGERPGLREVLSHLATTTWITRHWSAGQLLRRRAQDEEIPVDAETGDRGSPDGSLDHPGESDTSSGGDDRPEPEREARFTRDPAG